MVATHKAQRNWSGLAARVGLLGAGVLLAVSALLIAIAKPDALLWLTLSWGLFLVAVVLTAFGWRARTDGSKPRLDFLDTINQMPGDLWRPTQQLMWWRNEARAEAEPPRPAPTSPQAKQRIQQTLRDVQDTVPMDIATRPATLEHLTDAHTWGPHVWQDIEWRRLVTVVTGLFYQVGFKAQRFRPAGRTGADVWLKSGNGQLLLRCVASRAGVGTNDIAAFERTLRVNDIEHATFATGGTITEEARAYAAARSIHTLDGQQLLSLIASRTPDQRDSLLKTAYSGAYWRPTCVRCGVKLVELVRAEDQRPYWGCRNAPECTVVLPMDTAQSEQMKR